MTQENKQCFIYERMNLIMSTALSLNNINVNDFIKLIDACKGDLYLVTDEGDRLNLKSKLCQLIGLSNLIDGGIIHTASLVCTSIEDERLLVRYKLYKTIDAASEDASDVNPTEENEVA